MESPLPHEERPRGRGPHRLILRRAAATRVTPAGADAASGEYVFGNIRTGRHILDIKKGFTSAVADAGIVGLTFHDLRHTWATRAAELGVPEPVRHDILAHSPTSVTDEYTHSSPEARERAMKLVANFGNYGKITATAFQEAVAV